MDVTRHFTRTGLTGKGYTAKGSTAWARMARALRVCVVTPIFLAGIFLAGCGGVTVKDTVQLSGPRIAVLQSADDHGDNAETAIQIGQAKPLVMQGHVSARIEAAWVIGPHRLLLIASSTKNCPRQETLLVANGESGQLRPLGNCLERFMVTLANEQWTARLITSRPVNLRDPANWVFQNGTLSGAATQQNLGARRGRTQAAERGADADRASEAERPAEAERAAGNEAPPQSAPAPNPVQTPPISRPVGDDVVPAPVGAGPLPGRPKPSPRLF